LKKKIVEILKYILFTAFGLSLFYFVLKDQDFDRIKSILKNDVNYSWIWISIILGLLSHVSRTLRWNIAIESIENKPKTYNTFFSVMIGYFMNLVLPRMGEISRCGALAKYEKLSFAKLVGTVFIERILDILMLLIFTAIVVLSQFGKVLNFLRSNPEIKSKFTDAFSSPKLYITIAAVALGIYIFRKKFPHTKVYKKLNEIWINFYDGVKSVRNLKNKSGFIFHTVFIWIMYYLMNYVCFFSFDFTNGIPPIAGLTVFVFGSFGMVAPVQGGIGAWHFMTIEGLKLYGVNPADGIIFALLVHTAMTAFLILFGIISLLAMPFFNKLLKA